MLNVRQEAFCLHYAKTGNATESYKQAGYSPRTAGAAYASSNQLLKNPKVQKRLAELAAEMADAKIADIREIQEHLTAIFRGQVQEEQVVVEGLGDGVSEARIVKRAAQLKDVLKAGELLGKMKGGFDTNVNVNVAPIVIKDDVEE